MMKTVLAVALLLSACSSDEAESECWYLSSPTTCSQCTEPDGCPNLFQIMSCGPDTTGREFYSEDECVEVLDCGGCEN